MDLGGYKEVHTARGRLARARVMSDGDIQAKKSMLEIEAQLAEIAKRQMENKLLYYKPYPKQKDFHNASADYDAILFMAANQCGKSYCGAADVAIHLTGMYPDWWTGKRYNRPIRGWVAGKTSETTRDTVQRHLIGEIADGWGTGLIPKHCMSEDKMTKARGVSNLYDTILVKHTSGGWSEVKFKSYERGQDKWQSETLDFIWFDEEPPLDVYTEGYTRTVVKQGFIRITFTPLLGMSDVVRQFVSENNPTRTVIQMTIYEADHMSEEARNKAIANYPEHERDARTKGIPMLGSGSVFDVAEGSVSIEPFEIPKHWSWVWGIDFGMDHPFAAVLMAWDRDTDTMYVTHTIRMKGGTALQHAEAMKNVLGIGVGGKVPVAWPHDVHQRREFEGALVPLKEIYKKYGLNMHHNHATFADGSNATEIGVLMMNERMKSNRMKIFRTCIDWFDEFRMYHRKDGVIHKEHDDLMSATRMAVMMQRIAKPVLFSGEAAGRKATAMAKDLDMDPWAR